MSKKTTKKVAKSKARPVDAAERQLQAEVTETRASVEETCAPVCAFTGCYAEVHDYAEFCARHRPSEPHVVSGPSTAEEIAASDNAVIRESARDIGYRERKLAEAVSRYVPPPLADPPVLPDLTGRTLDFHTPPGRRGQLCEVAFSLLPNAGVVIWRTTDRLAGNVSYMLAAAGDLDDVQAGEVQSRMWHRATEEQHAAIAAADFETDLRALAKKAGPVAEAYAEQLLAAQGTTGQ